MFIFFILFLIVVYYFTTRNHDYWKKRNVKHDRPIPIFGNHLRNSLGLRSVTTTAQELYQKYPNENVVGYFRGSMPELIIRDPRIARRILTSDFPYFYQRGLGRSVNIEPLMANIFHAEGDIWKLLRKDMTPVFTTAKLKSMFPIAVRSADQMKAAIDEIIEQRGDCDTSNLMSRFTCEFIGSYVIGIESKSFKDPSYFQDLGKMFFDKSLKSFAIHSLSQLFPQIKNQFYIGDPRIEDSMSKMVKNVLADRDGTASDRNDYLDYLLKSREKGPIKTSSIEKFNSDGSPATAELEMDLKYITGQLFIFFIAGYETSASVSSCTLYNLALNPDIQEKIQEEIDEVLLKHDTELTYEAILEMPLLEMAVKESMRMFPPGGYLTRICTKQYTIPDLDITIDPGVAITIPIQAMQTDEKYFDNPQEFRPERFADKYNQPLSISYLPFGEGPRKCVGERLGYLLYMTGLATILRNYSVKPSIRTRTTIQRSRRNFLQVIEGGIPLEISRR